MANSWYLWDQDSLIIQVRLQPRASRDEIIGLYKDQLKIRITTPPIAGKANAYLIQFLAKFFHTNKDRIHLLSGATSQNKRIRIKNPDKLLLNTVLQKANIKL
ncbi:hypothetical conserved protein [Candidatus Nitrosoglobus terrae]|uniref:UPF0235 protein TAO_0073 n=1 Tax=Candidatus Nitrosoglobus terrae TaxID=1630141 RepID=A0A1Q2SK00_9GAMM|nr:DUF167 family protein [Candidatus Nitrosoglobus terrae]BAW79443.1 hypothetical conserved protein [Candidatus Nitrosoglobus terrae]